MALKFIRQLYSLDTLDTRFIVPATAPPKEALEDAKLDSAGLVPVQDGREKSRNGGDNVQPSRWNTPEFYFYYVVIICSLFFMFKAVLDVSKGSHKHAPYARTMLMSAQSLIQTTRSSTICCRTAGYLRAKW
jgi:hypothetical protein